MTPRLESSDLWRRRAQQAYAFSILLAGISASVFFAVYSPHQKAQQNMVVQIQQLQWEITETQKALRLSQQSESKTIEAMQKLQAESAKPR